MSSRLATRASSRSTSSSIVSRKSDFASSVQSTSRWSRLVTEALIDASGLRRSCETARSRATRRASASATMTAAADSSRKRRRSSADTSCAPRACTSRRSSPLRLRPLSTRIASAAELDLSAAGGRGDGRLTRRALHDPLARRCLPQDAPPPRARTSPGARSTMAGSGSSLATSSAAARASASASALARAASAVRAAAWTTRQAHDARRPPGRSTSARAFSASAIVNLWKGGVKNQLAQSEPDHGSGRRPVPLRPRRRPPPRGAGRAAAGSASPSGSPEVGEAERQHGQARAPASSHPHRCRRRDTLGEAAAPERPGARASSGRVDADDVDVERACLAEHVVDDRTLRELGQSGPSAGSEDQLGGVLRPGELDERLRRRRRRRPRGRSRRGPRAAVGGWTSRSDGAAARPSPARTWTPMRSPARAHRHPGRAPDQLLAARRPGERHHDPLPRLPGLVDAVGAL